MRWTVFDLEFTELMPNQNETWNTNLHVACASVLSTDEVWPQVWHESDGNHMSVPTLEAFIDTLVQKAQTSTLVTWGGSASDWRVLAVECPSRKEVVCTLALNSIDIPMCACMCIGMMMGLNAACKALGFTLKDSESSMSVPDMWRSESMRHSVLQHVSNDSFATMLVLKQAESSLILPWITRKGDRREWRDVQLITVSECLKKELPCVPFVIGPSMNAKLMARWLIVGLNAI